MRVAGLRAASARPIRHEVLWPALAALVAFVLTVGIGVPTLAAPPRAAGAVDLGFALAPCLVWATASLLIGRFFAAGLIRQGLLLSPASALLIAGGLVITGAFVVLPYEFLLIDLAGLTVDVVVPLWAVGVLLLVAAASAAVLARAPEPSHHDDARDC